MSGKVPAQIRRARRWIFHSALGVYDRLAPRKRVPGLLSLVVPVYNVERYLDRCLTSLRTQRYRHIEIIVVDDGSPDKSYDVAKRHANKDFRIRIVRQANGGLSAARNTGVRFAKGEFLAFVDSDDEVTPDGYVAAIAALRESGSDFAVMNYLRIRDDQVSKPGGWIRRLHEQDKLGVTLDECPDAQLNAVAWSKVYRKEFYDEAGLNFPVGKHYEDQPVSAAAYAQAVSFDVLRTVLNLWRVRDDESSISQQILTTDNLRSQIDAGESSVKILLRHGQQSAASARICQLLNYNMSFHLKAYSVYGMKRDRGFTETFVNGTKWLLDHLEDEKYAAGLLVKTKVWAGLALRHGSAGLETYAKSLPVNVERQPLEFPAQASGARAYVCGDITHLDEFPLEYHERELGAGDLTLRSGVQRTRFAEGQLVIDGWAFLAGCNPDADHTITVTLRAGTQKIPLTTVRRFEPRIDEFTRIAHVDYRRFGFTASLSVDEMPIEFDGGTGVFIVNVRCGDLEIEAPLFRRGQPESARWLISEGAREVVRYVAAPKDDPLTYRVDHGEFRAKLAKGRAQAAVTVVAADVVGDDIHLQLAVAHGERLGRMWLKRGDELIELSGIGHNVNAKADAVEGNTTMLVVHPFEARWGDEERAYRSGRYDLVVENAEGELLAVTLTEALGAALPRIVNTAYHRVMLRMRTRKNVPYLSLSLWPPLCQDEQGQRNALRLRAAVADLMPDPHETQPTFFFRSLYGEVANCNPKGLHEAILQHGIEAKLYWSVRDYSVPIPAGGIPVIQGSTEWYRLMRTSHYYMVNVHQYDWYHKPEGQVLIETFHGYPYKQMGAYWWRAHKFPARQVAEFDRRAREWDYVVSPASYATQPLLDAFVRPAGATPAMLEIGYPRNDILVKHDAVPGRAIRDRVRQLFGIKAHQTVVIYAPTFRDYLSNNDMTADSVNFVDFNEVATLLGDDYVFLLRGHPFNARAQQNLALESSERVIDVTDYPDINDLFLASDAAVLDYSSARFDYALMRKPMLYFVPDREQYHNGRPGLVEYEVTAPGPLLDGREDLVEALRRLDSWHAEYEHKLDNFLTNFADFDDGHAGERVLEQLGLVPYRHEIPKVYPRAPSVAELVAELHRMWWSGPETIQLEGWMYRIGHSDTESTDEGGATVAVALQPVGRHTEHVPKVVHAKVTMAHSPEVAAESRDAESDHAYSAFTAELDLGGVLKLASGAGGRLDGSRQWQLVAQRTDLSAELSTGFSAFTQYCDEGSAGYVPERALHGSSVRWTWMDGAGEVCVVDTINTPGVADAANSSTIASNTGFSVEQFTIDVSEEIPELVLVLAFGADVAASLDALTLTLEGQRVRLAPSSTVVDGDTATLEARFRLVQEHPWRQQPMPLASHERLSLVVGSGAHPATVPVTLAEHLRNELPLSVSTPNDDFRLGRTADDAPLVVRQPDTAVEERGVYAQAQLARAVEPLPVEPHLVYVESFRRRSVACNPRAIARALAVAHPELHIVWGVNDRAVEVPEDFESVITDTAAWWRIRGTAGLIITNDWLNEAFIPKPEQFVLQTWHGTPLKRLALDRPNVSDHFRQLVAHETSKWDLVLAESPYMEETMRHAYGLGDKLVTTGYPRNDCLAMPDGELNAVLRQRLGMAPDTGNGMVVLYAPTWREDKSDPTELLDLAALLERLPSDVTILVRAHMNTAGYVHVADRRLIDVGGYPDISELMMIADCLVTDYSSVMFDFAATQRPMILYVPDLEHYEETLRGTYFDVTEAFPGPLTRDVDALAAALLHILNDGSTPSTYAAWHKRFTPFDDGDATRRVLDELMRRGAIGRTEV